MQGFDALRNSVTSLDVPLKQMDRIGALDAEKYALARDAVRDLVGPARQMLIANYQKSGLGHNPNPYRQSSGALLNAVQLSNVFMGKKGLVVAMPSGQVPYANSKASFYAVAASLNFGSVRKVGGGKQNILRKKVAKKFKLKTLKNAEPGGSVSRGSFIVTRPHEFYFFQSFQIGILERLFIGGYQRRVNAFMGRAA